ncbi:hypothetical protein PC128_g17132 [Phytophthora cactorum]|nr:hypothetical protein PC120_g5217 [Phytophthora cactorum]KAG3176818.1 hypothetical protein PC128_g17132 [Phytophthora cactorum]KAG4051459.1 hypothetical protein PC123_g13341 [Phytophthora cactorum]
MLSGERWVLLQDFYLVAAVQVAVRPLEVNIPA